MATHCYLPACLVFNNVINCVHVPQTFPGVSPPGKPSRSSASRLWRLTVSLPLQMSNAVVENVGHNVTFPSGFPISSPCFCFILLLTMTMTTE